MSEMRPQRGPAIAGSVLGSYRILDEISSGGMGTVFRARHVLLGRPAAVKLLRADLTTDPHLVQRFVNEARAVTACKHPGIVEVYDFGYTPDGHAFIVMELLEGEPLGRRLARLRLGELEAAAIAHGIAGALKAAHRVGVIHRDLKPDNVFLVPDPDGGPDRPKVLDFGIAKLAEPAETATRHTRTGVLIGTPMYMAPEQARAAGEIDHRADLYSLGCILYHMLVGRPPFVADGGGEIIAMQLFGQVEPPSRLVAISPEMEQLVLRLLEKQPGDRFASAGDVASALAAVTARLGPRRRSARPFAVAGIVAVVAGIVVAYAVLRGDRGPREPIAAPPAAAPSPAAAAPPPAVTPPPLAVTPAAQPDRPAAPAPPARRPPLPRGSAAPGGTGRTGAPGASDPAVRDRPIERTRETRTVDPPRSGDHTPNESPIETDVDFTRKRASPSDPAHSPPATPSKDAP